jgi:hypothetical protein
MDIREFESQTTPRLILLSFVTFGVYPICHLRRLTKLVNAKFNLCWQVSPEFVAANIVFFCLSLAFRVADAIWPLGPRTQALYALINLTFVILWTVWCFQIGSRLNRLLESAPGRSSWFRGVWIFFLGVFYINYKINFLCDRQIDTANEAAATTPVNGECGCL